MCSTRAVFLWLQLCVLLHKIIPNVSQGTTPPVQLANGATVIGTVNTEDQSNPFYAYRGIPYAEPPIGNLRFRSPVPLSGDFSQVTINAFEDGSSCVQQGDMVIPTDVFGSEDCLYLNLYKPLISDQTTVLPVMVWIHGGGFRTGNGSYASYGPHYFMTEKVIVVTINYRLGIFGFFSTGDAASPGNYGLKDQLMALKWVHENIERFGGDPQRVTVFGESAGAASVSYLSQTPLSEGLFQSAIYQSGTSINAFALIRNPNVAVNIVASALNITISSSQILVDLLRLVDYRVLQTVAGTEDIASVLLNGLTEGIVFGPTIEIDHPGAIIVNKSYEQLSKGLFHRINYIIGYNSNEAAAFINYILLVAPYVLRYVPPSMNIPPAAILTRTAVDIAIKQNYYGNPLIISSSSQLIRFFSDNVFVRGILEATRLQSQLTPVYLYRFSYVGPLGSENRSIPGVGHAEENPYLWRQSTNPTNISSSDLLTRQRAVKLWTNFAKTGNPTAIADPLLQNVQWPLANSAGANNLACLDIDKNLSPLVNPDWANYQFWVNLFNRYGRPLYYTY